MFTILAEQLMKFKSLKLLEARNAPLYLVVTCNKVFPNMKCFWTHILVNYFHR
jgi:hypothetical protein